MFNPQNYPNAFAYLHDCPSAGYRQTGPFSWEQVFTAPSGDNMTENELWQAGYAEATTDPNAGRAINPATRCVTWNHEP